MLIKTVSLTNFRNHSEYHLDCKPTTTLILGANGCGKTSVLEAIYILTRGKSFRATDSDILKRNAPFYRIAIEYDTGVKIVATYDGSVKTFFTDDKKVRRLPSKNKYPVILFEPSDLNLITGSPSKRRDYFDRFFGQLSEEYSTNLSRYEKAIRQRNEFLKQETFDPTIIFSWNLLLARYGANLSRLRRFYIDQINQYLNPTYYSIAENGDRVFLDYVGSADHITESNYLKTLEQTLEKDRIIGRTSFGIHKDDFEFIFNTKKASGSASRGETRSIILAIKFLEAHLLEQTLQKRPIILLDDVFSELDEKRRQCLVGNFKNHQVIITSVERDPYLPATSI